MEHQIVVVGIGPGAPQYLLPAAREVIERGKVLVGGRRALESYARPGAVTQAITADLQEVMAFIAEWRLTEDVVVLVSGDPGYYSLLPALRRCFPARLLRVIPGISSMQLAFARLALPWQDARLVSLHGRAPQEEDLVYRAGALLGCLTDGAYNSRSVAALLLEKGWPPEAKLYVCARLSYEDESVAETTLGEAAAAEGVGHCILVVEA